MTARKTAVLAFALATFLAGTAAAAGRPGARASATPDIGALLERATAALDQRRAGEADSLASLAVAGLDASPTPDRMQLASALVTVARARAVQRSYADSVAVRSARRALALELPATPEADLQRALVRDALAQILTDTGVREEALGHARRALALRRSRLGDAHRDVSESWYRLGNSFMVLGRPDSALVAARAGLAVRERLDLPRDRRLGDFHAQIASQLERLGDIDGARAELDAALAEYARQLGSEHPANTLGLQRACAFAYRNGQLARAVDLGLKAVAIAESAPGYSASDLALHRGNLVIALMEIGDYARAKRVIEQVIPVYLQNLGPDHEQTLWAQVLLANANAALGDTTAAVAGYRAIVARKEAGDGSVHVDGVTEARAGLAEMLAETDPRAALAEAEAAEANELALAEPFWTSVVTLKTRQLSLQSRLGAHAAVVRLDRAIEEDLDAHGLRGSKVEVEALAERSAAAARSGDDNKARRLALAGARLSRSLLVRDVRALSEREGLALAGERNQPLDALLALAPTAGATDAAATWDELIRWRGLVAAEATRRRPPLGAGRDAGLRAAHAAWTQAERRLAQLQVRQAGGAAGRNEQQLAELQAAADDAGRRWAAVAPRSVIDGERADIGLADLKAALGAQEALVAFASASRPGQPPHMLAFVLRPDGPARVRDLGPVAAINDALSAWLAACGRAPAAGAAAAAERTCRDAGQRVRALTWDRVASLAKGARAVHLVAEGPLTQLPWGALPDARGRYLVESGTTIHVLAAERDLLAAPAPPEAGNLLALGDVAFDQVAVREGAPNPTGVSTRSVLRACGSDRPLAFPPLPGTGREIDEIARVHGGDEMLLRGAAATEAAFKAAAPGRSLLHLATHAVLLDDDCALNPPGMRGVGGLASVPAVKAAPSPSPSPWLGRRAVLALSGADRAGELDGDENEGLLTAEEVATLDLRGVDWVVLSACESGVADTWAREGRLGLTRAFHLAGAHAVIASLWPIDDDATVALMARLYAARAAGVTSAGEAMRRASCDVIAARRAAGLDTHPFAWAAFTPSGD